MNRLTMINEHGVGVCGANCDKDYPRGCMGCTKAYDAFSKLAMYEEREESGTLTIQKAKQHEFVYFYNQDKIIEIARYITAFIDRNSKETKFLIYKGDRIGNMAAAMIVENVYLTKLEAEIKLCRNIDDIIGMAVMKAMEEDLLEEVGKLSVERFMNDQKREVADE